jgi:hypothetical protein
MTVYQVGISDVESTSIVCICSTLEIAERELFKARDELVSHWKKMAEFELKSTKKYCEERNVDIKELEQTLNMYPRMIENLKSNDYKNWNNFPHDIVWINEMEIMDK